MSLLSSSKCVLFLNDEGVGIYDAGASRVTLVDTVPWDTQDFEESIAETISKKAGGRQILILSDLVEQHYRKEKIPKASALDRAGMIKRRMAATFPSYPIRAHLKLKEKSVAKDVDGGSGELYLFAAVPTTDNIRKLFRALSLTHSSIGGFSLLPVESAGMVQELSKKINKDSAATWTVFVGQHRNGGLRQIVTRNGDLALTRMTVISDSRNNPDIWSSEVAAELRGTMGYLARFGFDPRDGLDVMIVSEAASESIASKIDFECNLSVLSLSEAADFLKLKLGRDQDQRFSDALHVAWAKKKVRPTMPLAAEELSKIAAPARMAMAAAGVLVLGCLYTAYMAYGTMTAWHDVSQQIDGQKTQLSALRTEHEDEVAKKKAIGVDFMLIERAGTYYEQIQAKNMMPLAVLDQIGRALGPDIHLTSLEIKPFVKPPGQELLGAPQELDASGNPVVKEGPPPNEKFTIALMFSFPPTLPVDQGVKQVNDLQGRIAANLPGYDVGVAKQVADLSYTGNFVSEDKMADTAGQKQNYEAQINVTGELR